MSHVPTRAPEAPEESIPQEWRDLRQRVQALPEPERAEVEPLLEEALEQARFRGRVLWIAQEALQRLQLDLMSTQFDLEVTRRERERLRQFLDGLS
ncbi:hypothetical protein BH23PLA1_BH23PLA1_08350 [soil metagenome]